MNVWLAGPVLALRCLVIGLIVVPVLEVRLLDQVLHLPQHGLLRVFLALAFPAEVVAGDFADQPVEGSAAQARVYEGGRGVLYEAEA